jgi:hypothetical protein
MKTIFSGKDAKAQRFFLLRGFAPLREIWT